MAEQWFLYSIETSDQGSCVELWFCGYPNRGWAVFTDIDTDWWVYKGMFGSQGSSSITITGCIGATWNFVHLSGLPSFIRSDSGPEFTAKAVRHWLQRLNVQTLGQSLGRMATTNRSMASWGMSCWMEKFLRPCWKHRSWLKTGVRNITRFDRIAL